MTSLVNKFASLYFTKNDSNFKRITSLSPDQYVEKVFYVLSKTYKPFYDKVRSQLHNEAFNLSLDQLHTILIELSKFTQNFIEIIRLVQITYDEQAIEYYKNNPLQPRPKSYITHFLSHLKQIVSKMTAEEAMNREDTNVLTIVRLMRHFYNCSSIHISFVKNCVVMKLINSGTVADIRLLRMMYATVLQRPVQIASKSQTHDEYEKDFLNSLPKELHQEVRQQMKAKNKESVKVVEKMSEPSVNVLIQREFRERVVETEHNLNGMEISIHTDLVSGLSGPMREYINSICD